MLRVPILRDISQQGGFRRNQDSRYLRSGSASANRGFESLQYRVNASLLSLPLRPQEPKRLKIKFEKVSRSPIDGHRDPVFRRLRQRRFMGDASSPDSVRSREG